MAVTVEVGGIVGSSNDRKGYVVSGVGINGGRWAGQHNRYWCKSNTYRSDGSSCGTGSLGR